MGCQVDTSPLEPPRWRGLNVERFSSLPVLHAAAPGLAWARQKAVEVGWRAAALERSEQARNRPETQVHFAVVVGRGESTFRRLGADFSHRTVARLEEQGCAAKMLWQPEGPFAE